MKQKIIVVSLILAIISPIFLTTISLANESQNSVIEKEETTNQDMDEVVKEESPTDENNPTGEQDKIDESLENEEKESEVVVEKKEEEKVEEIEKIEQTQKLKTVAAPILETGIYEIYAMNGETKVIDIHGSSNNNNTNVEIYERNNQNNQKYKVQLNNDGTYTFFALHSNKVLDVEGARKVNETNVCQYTFNGGDNQKWYIKSSGDGYFNIVSKHSGLYLDLYQGQGRDGQNIQVYQGNGKSSQKFKFSKVITTGTQTLPDGIYNIYSQVADNRLLEVANNSINDEAQIITGTNKNIASQQFQVTYNKDNTYSIVVLHTGKALDVRYGSGKNKSIVQQYTKHGKDTQKWFIQKNSNGTYSLIAKCNGLALDINGGSTSVGAKVQTYNFNGNKSQQFVFKECNRVQTGAQTVEDGTYRMLSTINDKKVIQIAGGSTASGAVIQMWDNTESLQQKYDITYMNDGYYKIKSKISNKVLTVESITPRVGSNIKQETDNNLDTQKWIIKKYSEGVYAIISKCGNLYITLSNTNVQNGQSLQLTGQTDLPAQRFILVNETPKNNIVQIDNGIYQLITVGNKTVDIYGASYNNVSNTIIYNDTKAQNQKFEITKIGNTSYYKIVAVHSKKSLDVEGNSTNPGANIIQYTDNGANNQQWLIKDCGNGYYNIISKDSGLYLDVTGNAVSTAGTNVELWYGNGGNAQKFKLLRMNMINNDSYRITSQANSNNFLAVSGNSQLENANVQIAPKTGDNNQIFRVESTDYINYKIIARHSNKVLTVLSNNNVVQAEDKNELNQQWTIEAIGSNYYKIKSKYNNMYLHISGANVQVEKASTSSAQNFKFNNLEQKKGIDVSEHNGLINWEYVKKSGIDYAIIRIGYRGYREGTFAEDKYFRQNLIGAKKAGLKVGIYFFTQAINEAEARQEATWTLNKIKEVGYENKIEYPIAIDVENSGGNPQGRADGLDIKTRTAVCKAFCETIQSNGYRPMVYANKNWLNNYLDVTQLNQYNIWLAHFTYSPNKLSDYKYHYEIWQYSDKEQIMGIQGVVDMNICYQSY